MSGGPWGQIFETFGVAFGVVVGGALLGGLASLATGGFPAQSILTVGDRLKVWAAAAALGGTLVNLKTLEAGLLRFQLQVILKELGLMGLAFAGAFAAYWVLSTIAGR